MPSYDYIIIGAGAAGLLLANAFGNDSFFKNKKILLLDKSSKTQNDRTWCFWEIGEGEFDNIVHKAWSNIHFAGHKLNIKKPFHPYAYKMLRGTDFYQHYLDKIHDYENVDFVLDEIESVIQSTESVEVIGTQKSYIGQYAFDSRFDYKRLISSSTFPVLQQHFLGWFIKTDSAVFDTETATFMDFSIPQKGNTRFMYVLPFSKTEALVEYTLFSKNPLLKQEYENGIKSYLDKKLAIENYEIIEVEQGNIPMTSFQFYKQNTERYCKIGVSGGWAKPSTGYAFYNSAKKVKKLVGILKSDKPLQKLERKSRFWFYDLLLLDILHTNNEKGGQIFEAMFKNQSPQLILKFLDEDTTLWEDLKVIWACPKWPFIKAFIRRLRF